MASIAPGHAIDLLLAIDVQNDFCPGDALAVPGGDEIVPAINALARDFAHVVLTQDWHPVGHHSFARHPCRARPARHHRCRPWRAGAVASCVEETEGAAFHRTLETVHAELIVRKGIRREIDSYSAFFENDRNTPTGLAGYLHERGFRRIFLAGPATDFCVAWSAPGDRVSRQWRMPAVRSTSTDRWPRRPPHGRRRRVLCPRGGHRHRVTCRSAAGHDGRQA